MKYLIALFTLKSWKIKSNEYKCMTNTKSKNETELYSFPTPTRRNGTVILTSTVRSWYWLFDCLANWLSDWLAGWRGQLNAPAIKRYKIYHQIKNRLVPRENVNFSLFNSYTHLIVVLVRLIAFNAAFTLLIALVIVGILYLYKRSIFMIFKSAADTRREMNAIGAAHSFSDFVWSLFWFYFYFRKCISKWSALLQQVNCIAWQAFYLSAVVYS